MRATKGVVDFLFWGLRSPNPVSSIRWIVAEVCCQANRLESESQKFAKAELAPFLTEVTNSARRVPSQEEKRIDCLFVDRIVNCSSGPPSSLLVGVTVPGLERDVDLGEATALEKTDKAGNFSLQASCLMTEATGNCMRLLYVIAG